MRCFHPDFALGPVMERENRISNSGLSAIQRQRLPIFSGMNRSLLLRIALGAAPTAFALDGKWTPAQVLDMDPARKSWTEIVDTHIPWPRSRAEPTHHRVICRQLFVSANWENRNLRLYLWRPPHANQIA